MPDKYANFAQLERSERRGLDFLVRSRALDTRTAVIAPHGGRIEPGTSEIAEAIAGTDFTFYAFEGTKLQHNGYLHITSTRFDEPICLALVANAEHVIAIHGENSDGRVVFLGGRDGACMSRIREALRRDGFCVKAHTSPQLQGVDARNICNRGRTQQGVQIELSNGLRRSLFRSLSTRGRQEPTERFKEFVSSIRDALHIIERNGI